MRRILLALGGAGIVAAITAGVVFAQNYEGEDFCQDTPSWPNGTYLGQMHPYHSDFYRGYAERRGWDPCVTWAQDQRNSAIRGLRELGYTVTEPEGGAPPPGPAPTASASTSFLPPVSLDVYSAVGGGHASSSGVAFSVSVNYEGENFCKDTPSWPNGTYLGQMHPFHSDFYRGYAERRGWDPCVTWAQDQRNSAIRGLRELGYAVIEPDGGAPPPGRVVTPFVATSSLPLVDPDLYSAVWRGQTDRVRALVAGGANVNARTSDNDPLIREAIWRNHEEIVQILVGVDRPHVAAADDGHPVLREAIWRNHVDVVQVLVDVGADVDAIDADGDPLLFEAVWRGHTAIVQILADAGVDVNARDSDGESALSEARFRGHAEIVQILLDCGAT